MKDSYASTAIQPKRGRGRPAKPSLPVDYDLPLIRTRDLFQQTGVVTPFFYQQAGGGRRLIRKLIGNS